MPHKDIHEVTDGLQFQDVAESVSYSVNTTKWGGSPTSISHEIYDENDFTTDLKGSLMSGTPTANGDDIELPALSGLTKYHVYRVKVLFTSSGNDLVGYFRVRAI